MEVTVRKQNIKGFLWSFIDSMAGEGIQFVIGIILARLLMPREFGLIGMIYVFIAVSESFINSGFSSALIRKKDCTQKDYSTVFFFNLFAGIVFFAGLFLAAPAISSFFSEPQLKNIVRVLGLVLVIDALSLIQHTILTKRIDFKLQARISVISSVASGLIAIWMAYRGYGVWGLVAQRISRQAFNTLFLLLWNNWLPSFTFSNKSFKELFGFGSKLLASNIIDNIYNNLFSLIIGKYFSAAQTGLYAKADEFNRLPAHNLSGIIGRVSYPILCEMQNDPNRLRDSYRKLIKSTMFLTFFVMIGLAAIAEPLILSLIGEQWRESVVYFQMLAFVGMFYPLHVINLNMLQVKGRSDLFLKLEIGKKLLSIPAIVAGILFGIKVLLAGMMVNALLDYYLNSYYSGRLIGYSIKEQIKDILPSFILAAFTGILMFTGLQLSPYANALNVYLTTIFGTLLLIFVCELIKFRDYLYIKKQITGLFPETQWFNISDTAKIWIRIILRKQSL